MGLSEFLLARIAEDEADALEVARQHDRWQREQEVNGADGSQCSIVASLIHPARVLAECGAKRRIVGLHSEAEPGAHECPGTYSSFSIAEGDPCPTLLLLALPYAGHPDYDPEWKP